LVEGALDFTAFFDFDFSVMDFSHDLAGGAHDQAFFADDGVVQLTTHIDELGSNSTCDAAGGTNQNFFSSEVAFDHAVDHRFGGHGERTFDHDAIANDNTF